MLPGKYKLYKNVLSIGGDYTVDDAAGTTVLAIDGKLRFAATFSVADPQGRVLYTGSEHVFNLDRKFDIARDGVPEASLHRETVSGHKKIVGSPTYRFVVERRNGETYEARGVFSWRWTLQRDGTTVAQVETDGQVSEIDLPDPAGDGAFILTVVMAIVRLNPPARSGTPSD